MKLRCGAGAGKGTGAERQWQEAGSDTARVNCDCREKPLEKIQSRLQADLCSARIPPALQKNEASVHPARSVPVQDGLNAELIRLGFQVREGGLSREEIIGLGSGFLKRQDSQVMKSMLLRVSLVSSNVLYSEHLLCFLHRPGKPVGPNSSPAHREHRILQVKHSLLENHHMALAIDKVPTSCASPSLNPLLRFSIR